MYPAYIHTQTTARNIDQAAIKTYQIPSLILMEHAAIKSAEIIKNIIKPTQSICILCGPGNNGADGLAIARNLYNQYPNMHIVVPEMKTMSEDEKIQFQMIQKLNIPYSKNLPNETYDFYIDCLFGNGLTRDITGFYKTIIQAVNSLHKQVISIDMPSGIDATMGNILGCAIHANHTISIDCYKQGQWLNDGRKHCGKLYLIDIGIPPILHEKCMDKTKILCLEDIHIPSRPSNAHKSTFGKALMIGGSHNMHGAIHMASLSAYKSGIGTITLMVPECISNVLAVKSDFYMLLQCPDHNGIFSSKALDILKQNISNYTILSIGNGMQKNNVTIALVEQALKSDKKIVLDADAIWAAGKNINLLKREAITILTPHIKEMSDLTGIHITTILANPFEVARDFSKEYKKCVLILKSSQTFIAYQGSVFVLDAQNAGLAKGGSGDILCGIVVAMLGQTKDPLQAALCAAYIHSQSAKLDIDSACFMPEDIINNIPNVLKKLRS